SRLYVPAGYDTPVDDELPLTAGAERGSATEPTRHWPDDQREMQRLDEPGAEDVVAHDNARSQHVFIDESDVAPIPGPVPPARPRQEPMHRPRVVQALPDLDDNLFAGHFDRVRQEQRAADAVDRVPATTLETKTSTRSVDRVESSTASLTSPRDSYFRAAQYRDWTGPRARVTDEETDAHPARLPDLEEHHFDLREVVARGGELMDMTIDIAPEIPRECRTCRSFRSADGGARGWCTNEWAFTHRRMVNEDDLACDSTIGCWWLPADRYWLIEERDGFAATPRMDKLMTRRYQQEPEREGASG
ncbi:MAG: hypothetical protein M3173_02635, partial [Chloroflexota bacterium]|nr:hypothetical protein [Chloroflexota bacterium]